MFEDTTGPLRRKPWSHRTRVPTSAQLTQLAGTIAHRACRHLARKDWLEGEDESMFPCPHITRPAISEKRLSISPQGRVRCEMQRISAQGVKDLQRTSTDGRGLTMSFRPCLSAWTILSLAVAPFAYSWLATPAGKRLPADKPAR